jgi:hypothetical protein
MLLKYSALKKFDRFIKILKKEIREDCSGSEVNFGLKLNVHFFYEKHSIKFYRIKILLKNSNIFREAKQTIKLAIPLSMFFESSDKFQSSTHYKHWQQLNDLNQTCAAWLDFSFEKFALWLHLSIQPVTEV